MPNEINGERWTNKQENKTNNKQKALVLPFKQKFCHSLTRWLGSVFFFSFFLSVTAASSDPLSVSCGCLSLYAVLRFQRSACNPPAILLWSWVFTVLICWGLVSLPLPLPLGQGQWSISQPPDVSMLWWFSDCFSTLQCHLTLDVTHWLRRWVL
jgi:hypothetical protein